jgi:hypothetical protein
MPSSLPPDAAPPAVAPLVPAEPAPPMLAPAVPLAPAAPPDPALPEPPPPAMRSSKPAKPLATPTAAERGAWPDSSSQAESQASGAFQLMATSTNQYAPVTSAQHESGSHEVETPGSGKASRSAFGPPTR